jgi:hypothetical protein
LTIQKPGYKLAALLMNGRSVNLEIIHPIKRLTVLVMSQQTTKRERIFLFPTMNAIHNVAKADKT